MGRIYTCPMPAITVSAIQDLYELIAAADSALRIIRCEISQEVSETSEMLAFQLKMAAGAYTSGSGGGTITPAKTSTGDAASSSTCERNNTTQALVGSGTLVEVDRRGENVLNGRQWIWLPEERFEISPTDAFIVSLPTAPAAALTMSGNLVFEEIGG